MRTSFWFRGYILISKANRASDDNKDRGIELNIIVVTKRTSKSICLLRF
jgi:hypothetical protein